MSEESTTISHLSVAMTTTEAHTTQAVSGRWWTVDRYVQLAVIVIGVVGTAGNALILYALVASKQHKKHMLILNQNALDLFGSFFLIVSFAVRLCDIRYVGALGYWLCVLFVSEIFVWWGFVGSVVNLATITVDRYLKVVHHTWSKRWLRPKVINMAVVFAWFMGIIANASIMFPTSGIKDGKCYAWVLYRRGSPGRIASIVWYITSFYVIILAIFIFCYGRILIAIRHHARVTASQAAAESSTSQSYAKMIQIDVIKTMIIVSAYYAIAWLPSCIYYVFILTDLNLTYSNNFWYAAMFLASLYTSTNPFIYAAKFNPVRRKLESMIPWRKVFDQTVER